MNTTENTVENNTNEDTSVENVWNIAPSKEFLEFLDNGCNWV